MEDRIKRVLDHIEENLRNRLELKDLAAVACLSPSQFHRQFKRQTGRRPFKFVEELKMNKAYQMILQESRMIHELSDMFGYKDYETFSRAFKKYFHFSPDDLKAIVEVVRANICQDEEQEMMILTFDESSKNIDLFNHLKAFLKEKNVKISDLNQTRFYKVAPKDLVTEKKSHLIKNKFAMTKEDKLWKMLIKNDKTTGR